MKTYLKTPALLLLFLLPICLGNKYLQSKLVMRGLEIRTSARYLVFGDSHAVCSFDPAKIPSTQSVANYGESIVLSYYKLRKLIEANPERQQLTLLVSLSHHTLYPTRENFWDPAQRPDILRSYYPLLDREGRELVGRYGGEYFLSALKYDLGVPFAFKTSLEILSGSRTLFNVGYENTPSTTAVTKEHALHKIEEHYGTEASPLRQSPLLVEYLERYLELAMERQWKVVLINSPKNPRYLRRIPKRVEMDHRRLVERLVGEYSHVTYLDESGIFKDDKFFRDTDHLNSLGAAAFSTRLKFE